MSIGLQDTVAVGQDVARRALETVEAARAVDLHGPADAAKTVARRTAKRAAKHASAAAHRATGRTTERRARITVRRVAIGGVVAGVLIAAGVLAARRARSASRWSAGGDTRPELDGSGPADRAGVRTEDVPAFGG